MLELRPLPDKARSVGRFRRKRRFAHWLSHLTHQNKWCSREDSNLHGFPHTVLSRARLPVPPRERFDRGLAEGRDVSQSSVSLAKAFSRTENRAGIQCSRALQEGRTD